MENNVNIIWELLDRVSDPREASGKRYPLQGVLSLIVAAVSCGNTSLRSIAKWGRELTRNQLAQFHLRRQSPSQTTMHNLLQRIDPKEIETLVRSWIAGSFLEKSLEESKWRAELNRLVSHASSLGSYTSLKVLTTCMAAMIDTMRKVSDEFRLNGWKLPERLRREGGVALRLPDWISADLKTPYWMRGEVKTQFENLKRIAQICKLELEAKA